MEFGYVMQGFLVFIRILLFLQEKQDIIQFNQDETMSTQIGSQQDKNQPQIATQKIHQTQKQHQKEDDLQHNKDNPEKHQERQEQKKKTEEIIKNIRERHPQCIPVFYLKHQASPKQFPSPKVPFILFKKSLKIQQAMYSLYNQIQIKGLYFFCTRYNQQQKKLKYIVLKTGETIQQVLFLCNLIKVYNKYGRDGHLTLIYGDKNIGMGGVNRMEKYLVRILVVLAIIWILLYGYPLYLIYDHEGLSAVWDNLSLFAKANTNQSPRQQLQQTHINDNYQSNQTAQKVQISNSQQVLLSENNHPGDMFNREQLAWKQVQLHKTTNQNEDAIINVKNYISGGSSNDDLQML